jgi:hypothetical protein
MWLGKKQSGAWRAFRVCGSGFVLSLGLLDGLAAQPAATPQGSVIVLNQGWTADERAWYYQATQGSAVMSYDIFLNLEAAGSQELFRSDAISERYGLITQPANPNTNPDALPVGLSKTVVPRGAGVNDIQVGLTCAACHNSQLNYKGKRVRIDGGAGFAFDMMAYVSALDDAVQGTLADPQKLERLAARVGASGSDAKTELTKRLEREAAPIHQYRTRALMTPIEWGPARMDAISAIINRLVSIQPRIPENLSTPLAPTKPPFLWNTPQGTWTQWRAVQQDPIERNLIETMGVFMPMNLIAKSPQEGLFSSAAELANLQVMENQLMRLTPPQWPEEVFGRIDRQKAAAGKALFMNHCASCHNAWPYTWTEPNKYGKRFLQVGLIPQKHVGTDPGQFEDARPYAITAQLGPNLRPPFKDKPIIPTGALYEETVQLILGTALATLSPAQQAAPDLHGFRELPVPRPNRAPRYKAAPRDGVWATPPFLHNGSVPNLYEMLIPARERTKKFYFTREFDPVKVGMDTTGKSGDFMLDTTLRGNSNEGHSFEKGPRGNGVIGPLLTESQRWELVEYLKSIPEEAGRVTPFGGPPDAKTSNNPWTREPRE